MDLEVLRLSPRPAALSPEVGDGAALEMALDGVTQASKEASSGTAEGLAQETAVGHERPVDQFKDVQQTDLLGVLQQAEPSPGATSGVNESVPGQTLENFGQVVFGDLQIPGDLECGGESRVVLGREVRQGVNG